MTAHPTGNDSAPTGPVAEESKTDWVLVPKDTWNAMRATSPPAQASAEPVALFVGWSVDHNGHRSPTVIPIGDDLDRAKEKLRLYAHPAPDADLVAMLREAELELNDAYGSIKNFGVGPKIRAALARKP